MIFRMVEIQSELGLSHTRWVRNVASHHLPFDELGFIRDVRGHRRKTSGLDISEAEPFYVPTPPATVTVDHPPMFRRPLPNLARLYRSELEVCFISDPRLHPRRQELLKRGPTIMILVHTPEAGVTPTFRGLLHLYGMHFHWTNWDWFLAFDAELHFWN
jgi:hypothetical protein